MSVTEHSSIQTIPVPLHNRSESNVIANQTATATSEPPTTGPAEPSVNQLAIPSKKFLSVI
jgi:hypothetical protein